MRKIQEALVSVCCVLLFAIAVSGQESVPLVILNVKASGFKIEPLGVHTYLRVYDNGHVEFEDYKPSIKRFYHYASRLSEKQLVALHELLDSSEVKALGPKHFFVPPLKNIAPSVEIAIVDPHRLQQIELEDSGKSTAKVPVEKGLIDLICAIEAIRTKGFFRLIDPKACVSFGARPIEQRSKQPRLVSDP